MDLNSISLVALSGLILYGAYVQYKIIPSNTPKTLITPWGEQVGRTRPIQSKTGDASMATERTRRRAIQHVGKINPKKLKETRTSSGSTTGIIETYFITSTCTSFEDCSTPILPDVPPPIILDGSSWSYPGNMSFTTSNIPSSRNVLDLILTVNNDIVNNDMTIVFAGNTVLTATVGAIELIVNDGIISVPSGTFGLTDNSLNIIFENVINAGSNLDMTINPVFQELYLGH